MPIFHEDITYILQEEIPHITQPYIDNIPHSGVTVYHMIWVQRMT